MDISKIISLIEDADEFCCEFVAVVTNNITDASTKANYVMDNQEELQKYIGVLKDILSNASQIENENVRDRIVDRCKSIIGPTMAAIAEYRETLIIDDSIMPEDITPKITKEMLQSFENNEVLEKTEDKEENCETKAPEEDEEESNDVNTFCVMDNNTGNIISTFKVKSGILMEQKINMFIRDIACDNISLYKLTEVPLEKKVVFVFKQDKEE